MKHGRFLLVSIIALCFASLSFASPQMPDMLIYKGKKYEIYTYPLEQYFNKYPNKRPSSKVHSTNLDRGYQAVFKIDDDILKVKDIRGYKSISLGEEFSLTSRIRKVFPNRSNRCMCWYSGDLVIFEMESNLEKDEEGEYKYVSHTTFYILTISNGILQEVKEMKEREFEQSEYYFMNSDGSTPW